MRAFAAGLLVLLSACAGPDLRRSETGDYWLGGDVAYLDSAYYVYGGYPWWYAREPYYGMPWYPSPLGFRYYSRNFYPHHFAVLYPPWPAYHPAWFRPYPGWGPVYHGWGHPHRGGGMIGDSHDPGHVPAPPAAAPEPPLTVIPPTAGFARGSERTFRRHGITPVAPGPNTAAPPTVNAAVGIRQGRMAEFPPRVPPLRARSLSAAPGAAPAAAPAVRPSIHRPAAPSAAPAPTVRPAITRPVAPGSVRPGVNRRAPDIPRR